jgi:hypothetical protein
LTSTFEFYPGCKYPHLRMRQIWDVTATYSD